MNAQDLPPAPLVRHPDHDLPIKPPRPSQRLVDRLRPVRRRDHHEVRTRLQSIHQRQQLRDEALLRLALHPVALGGDRIDLIDEHDRGRGLGRLLEHLAQPRLGLPVSGAHDLRPVDQKELRIRFVGDRACQPRLARSRRAIEQQPLGGIDTQPLEQLGIAQRQFDHFAQLVDRRRHAADIVIGDVGTPLRRLLIFGAQLDFGIFVDMHHALGAGLHHGEPDLLQGIGGRVHVALHARRHVRHPLLPCGRDHIALAQRTPEKGALQRVGGALQAQILLRRRKDDARRRLRFHPPHFHEIARADTGIGALQPVDPEDIQPFILGIGADRTCRRRLLADDLDHVTLGDLQRRHQRARQVREAASRVLGAAVRHLYLARRRVAFGHAVPRAFRIAKSAPRGGGFRIAKGRGGVQCQKKGPIRRPAHESF